jgi:hypothetical protein
MRPIHYFVALLFLSTVVPALAQVEAPQKPTRSAPAAACKALSSSETGVNELATRLSDAQIAYLHLRAGGESAGSRLRECEAVVWAALERLAKSNQSGAVEAVTKLVADPAMNWTYSDSLRGASVLAASSGQRFVESLRPHIRTSKLAKEAVECIDSGHKSCM